MNGGLMWFMFIFLCFVVRWYCVLCGGLVCFWFMRFVCFGRMFWCLILVVVRVCLSIV